MLYRSLQNMGVSYRFSTMFSSLLMNICISFFIILSIHYLWNYVRDTFTEKKTKDLVGSQVEKYKMIIEDLEKNTFHEKEEITDQDKELLDDDLDQYIATLDCSEETTTRIDL